MVDPLLRHETGTQEQDVLLKLKDTRLQHCAKENTCILIIECNVPIHKGSMNYRLIYYTVMVLCVSPNSRQ